MPLDTHFPALYRAELYRLGFQYSHRYSTRVAGDGNVIDSTFFAFSILLSWLGPPIGLDAIPESQGMQNRFAGDVHRSEAGNGAAGLSEDGPCVASPPRLGARNERELFRSR